MYQIKVTVAATSLVALIALAAGCGSQVAGSAPHQATERRAIVLPQSFPRYHTVLATIGRLMAQKSSVPVLLPTRLIFPGQGPIEVKYHVHKGYALALGFGPALPANSPRIQIGNAELIYTVIGQPWSRPYPTAQRYLPLHPKLGPSSQTVRLAPGMTARVSPSTPSSALPHTMLITWLEDGWTINFLGAGVPSTDIINGAKQVAKMLTGMNLPGSHGRATFDIGSDDPSIASFDLHGTRYVIEVTSWRATRYAARMRRILP